MVACSSSLHPDVYTYNNQAYTTTSVSEFEVDHFRSYGTKNFVVIEDSSRKETHEQRSKDINTLCRQYVVHCQNIDLANKKLNIHDEFVRMHKSFNGKKYFVFSLDKETTALYAGTLNVVLDKGNKTTLNKVFKLIGVKDTGDLESQLLALKKTN